jgi:hypothetical protein
MKKVYYIKAEYTFTGTKYFEVAAESEEEAEDIASEMAYDYDQHDMDDMYLDEAYIESCETVDCDGPFEPNLDIDITVVEPAA